jgi:hypothetical protein
MFQAKRGGKWSSREPIEFFVVSEDSNAAVIDFIGDKTLTC